MLQDGKNNRPTVELQSNISKHCTLLYTRWSCPASRTWYPTQSHIIDYRCANDWIPKKQNKGSTYHPAYQIFHEINFIWKHSNSSSSYTRWSDRFDNLVSFRFLNWFYFLLTEIAWRTHTEIFSTNHNRESTFSHVGKAVSSNQKSAVRMNQSVRKRVHVVFGASSILIHRSKFVEFPLVYSSFLANLP